MISSRIYFNESRISILRLSNVILSRISILLRILCNKNDLLRKWISLLRNKIWFDFSKIFLRKFLYFSRKFFLFFAKAFLLFAKTQFLFFLKSSAKLEFHFSAYFANREILFASFQRKIAFFLARNVHHYEKFVEFLEIDLIFFAIVIISFVIVLIRFAIAKIVI